MFPIEPRNTYGKDSLAYWENFLTESQINQILALPNWLVTERGKVGSGGAEGKINPQVRRTDIGWMDVNEQTLPLWQTIGHAIAEVNSRFFHFDLTGCYEKAQLGVYCSDTQDHYNWHIDAAMVDRHTPRKLSMSLLLSDPSEFEGGELQVKLDNDEPHTLEMKKGRAWFFPSWVLHRVTPVTKGVRRSLVIWVGGPPFK